MSDNLSATPGKFDFSLTADQEERAARLHRESIVIDLLSQGAGGNIFACYPQELLTDFRSRMHHVGDGFDALAEALFWPYEMSRLGKSDLIRDWLKEAGLTCITYDIPVYENHSPKFRKWEEMAERYATLPWLRYVTTAAEIRAAKRDGVIAAYAFWQPFIPTAFELHDLDRAYAKGLRSFMLTYNTMDRVGVGCTERVDAGLSTFGIEVLARCNDLGIIADVSHCGRLTTLDACRHSKKPVNANHTAARAVYEHARAKSDEELRAIADTGGVIGVVALPFFLSGAAHPTIEHMLDHIDYIANLIGWQHVAIGSDWPMQAPDDILRAALGSEARTVGFRAEDRFDVARRLVGFDDCRDIPNIARGLVRRGYTDEQVRGILGENALRVFSQVWA